MGFELPPYPYDLLDPYRALANQHSGGVVDLSVGTPCDPPPEEAVRALVESDSERGGAERHAGHQVVRSRAFSEDRLGPAELGAGGVRCACRRC